MAISTLHLVLRADATVYPSAPPRSIFLSGPNVGATIIELYPFDNYVGTNRIGLLGRNDVNPNMPYVTYKVVP